jgi:DNA repair photolyase
MTFKDDSNILTFPATVTTETPGIPTPLISNYGPIETKMRKTLSGLKNTSYPDNFNWSIYDKIASRFGDAPPRGGTVFNTTFKLLNHHSSCSKCHYSFEIDTYGRGCVHNCTYCYAKEILTRHGYWNEPMPFPVNLAEVRKIFYTVFETNKTSRWREVLEKRVPVRIGSMSDSFMWMDDKYGVSLELLKILKHYNYPYIIFTRSDLVATQKYVDAMDTNLASIQFSMSGGNEEIVRKLEPGAPSIKRRLAALKVLSENGFWTTVRLNPFFPIYPDGYFTDQKSIIERFGTTDAVPKFDLFDWSFLEQIKEHKVPSVLAGVVRLSPFAIRAMSEKIGFNLASFFKPELYSKSSESRYSDTEIAYYYKKLQVQSAKIGLRFSTCYIGMGNKDYYQHQGLWSNKSDCCDAKTNIGSFKTTSHDISWETRIKHATDKDAAKIAMESDEKLDKEIAEGTSVLPGLKTHLRLIPELARADNQK